MRYRTLKYRAAAPALAVLSALAVAACGGSSNSSSSSGASSSSGGFVSSANSVCATNSTTQGGVYEAVGERYKPGSAPWAAGIAAGSAVALHQMYVSLKALNPPSGQSATYKTLLGDVKQGATAAGQERSAAASGDQTAYKAAAGKLTSLSDNEKQLASQIGLASCADNSLSSTDKASITHVVTTSPTTNSSSQCTQEMTLAFVKQQFGTMAACIQNGKQPVGANNPKTVDVSSISGAGAFANANVVFHFASGKSQNLSVALYQQNGSWRLLGVQGQ